MRMLCLGLLVASIVATDPKGIYGQGQKGETREKESDDQRTRAFQTPDKVEVENATRGVMLVLVIGMLGCGVLILLKSIWYQPRFFELPYRPTVIVKSFRDRVLRPKAKASEAVEPESSPVGDLETLYRWLEEEK